MSQSEQGIEAGRYKLIPRTVVFLRSGDSYLLLKGAPTRKRWPNQYNGIGGHVERGEDVLNSARRELKEETGLEASLRFCGSIIVDVDEIGVALFVFSGAVSGGQLRGSEEGDPEWIPYDRLASLPAPEDLIPVLDRIHHMRSGEPPFAARSTYDAQGKLTIAFSEPA